MLLGLKTKDLLLVEPHPVFRAAVRSAVRPFARVNGCADFGAGRSALFAAPYDWLATNLRLGAFNGLHLVYLASTSRLRTRSLVYGDLHDVSLAREAQRAGAFFSYSDHVVRSLPALLGAPLPDADRRDPGVPDRRNLYRGGRRCTDIQPVGPVLARA